MKTLREMIDLIEAGQSVTNEGWWSNYKAKREQEKSEWRAIRDKFSKLTNDIEQLLIKSGLYTDDIDLLVHQLPLYYDLKNNQIDITTAANGTGGDLTPFVDYENRSRGEVVTKLRSFVRLVNQLLQHTSKDQLEETSSKAIVNDLTR